MAGLARVAVTSWWRATAWTVGEASKLAHRAVGGEPVAANAAADLRRFVRQQLGLVEVVGSVPGSSTDELRERGADLLRRSADVTVAEEGHPAYARILSELTPDEARVLRFLFGEGPQPAVDVRTNRPLGVGSELVAGGLNMIAEHAGALHVDRINLYLTNLSRLGLVEFSSEKVANPNRYQLVEAQPKVAEARARAGRSARTVHRSVALTGFGAEFCRTCLPG